MGYLQIVPDSLEGGAAAGVAEGEKGAGVEEQETITALMAEYARMRLKIPPKKGDMRDFKKLAGDLASRRCFQGQIDDHQQPLTKVAEGNWDRGAERFRFFLFSRLLFYTPYNHTD